MKFGRIPKDPPESFASSRLGCGGDWLAFASLKSGGGVAASASHKRPLAKIGSGKIANWFELFSRRARAGNNGPSPDVFRP